MANDRTFPHASSAAYDPGPSILQNTPANLYGVTKQCACPICAGSTSNGPPTWYNTYHQNWDTRLPGVSTDTYTNQGQGVSNLVGASLTTPGPGVQDQNNTDSRQVAVDTPQTLGSVQPEQPHQDPTVRISVAEGLRRLADRYVNNPNSVVDVVRLEPGPSGGFQVVIILGVANLL